MACKWPSSYKLSFKSIFFLANMTIFQPVMLLSRMGMYIRMPQDRNWKKVFAVNSQNIKQAIGIQVTFILEIEFQKYIF